MAATMTRRAPTIRRVNLNKGYLLPGMRALEECWQEGKLAYWVARLEQRPAFGAKVK